MWADRSNNQVFDYAILKCHETTGTPHMGYHQRNGMKQLALHCLLNNGNKRISVNRGQNMFWEPPWKGSKELEQLKE